MYALRALAAMEKRTHTNPRMISNLLIVGEGGRERERVGREGGGGGGGQ